MPHDPNSSRVALVVDATGLVCQAIERHAPPVQHLKLVIHISAMVGTLQMAG